MLKWYFYLGVALITIAQINFLLVIKPLAYWYVPIVWWGFILVVDSIAKELSGKSLISTYPKEFAFMVFLSIPFWGLFEVYNIFTHSWYYVNYFWYVHLFDFMIIMPAFLETFTLMNVLRIGKQLDHKKPTKMSRSISKTHGNILKLLVVIGFFSALLPVLVPKIGYPFEWFGLFLLIDPLNYITGRPSIIDIVSRGRSSILLQFSFSGLITGFFMEFWNYQAYPKWFYVFSTTTKLFEMPLQGYLGYIPFTMEAFLFFAFFRPFIFKKKNSFFD